MASRIDIEQGADADGQIVVIRGEIDADNCSVLRERVAPSGGRVTLDLAGVEFLDSSGVSELLQLRERAAEAGGTLVVSAVSAPVRKVLEITGLTELLGVQ